MNSNLARRLSALECQATAKAGRVFIVGLDAEDSEDATIDRLGVGDGDTAIIMRMGRLYPGHLGVHAIPNYDPAKFHAIVYDVTPDDRWVNWRVIAV